MTSVSPSGMSYSKIGIIGGGISGIAAAKQLAKYEPVVFEATESLGGVWSHCAFRSTKLQTPRSAYQFSDFPWPPPHNGNNDNDTDNFPSHREVVDYLYSYASHFDLLRLVRFNSKVVQIRHVPTTNWNTQTNTTSTDDDDHNYGSLLSGKPAWEVAVLHTNTNTTTDHDDHSPPLLQWYSFECLVMCTGLFGDIPNIPTFPNDQKKGPQVFKGKVLHSMDYSKLDKEAATQLLHGKKVVVVGYRKSAIDLALECAQANQGEEGEACTMVIRTLHWTVPHYWIWGLPFYLFYSTRFSQFLHHQPNQGFLRTLLCHLFSPLRRGVSKMIESYLVRKLPLEKYGLKPEHPFEEDYASCQMAIMTQEFFDEADKGKIKFKISPSPSSKWWFWEGGLEFEDQTRLEADVVIFATGFDGKKKLQSIIPHPFSNFLEFPSGMMPLYRGTIHPLIPNMGFVGYVQSVSNLQTAELRCKWLARLVGNEFKLPGVEKMMEQSGKEMEIMRKTTRFYKKQCISTFSINHNDEICKEMGWSPWRKTNWLAEAFSPYTSQDYTSHISAHD